VEFYFSDSNLPRDKFLRETVQQSDDGCNHISFTLSMSPPTVLVSSHLLWVCDSLFLSFCNCAVVSLALICSFSRMKSHLGLDAAVKAETMPDETVLAVAEVLRRSPVLRLSEDGGRFHSPCSVIFTKRS
jgi:lupus La protein